MTNHLCSLSILPPLQLVIPNLLFKATANPASFVQIFFFGSPLLFPNLFAFTVGTCSQHIMWQKILFHSFFPLYHVTDYFLSDMTSLKLKRKQREQACCQELNTKQLQVEVVKSFYFFLSSTVSFSDVTTSTQLFTCMPSSFCAFSVVFFSAWNVFSLLCPSFKTLESGTLQSLPWCA